MDSIYLDLETLEDSLKLSDPTRFFKYSCRKTRGSDRQNREQGRWRGRFRRLDWLKGGFPDSYLAASDGLSMGWPESLVRTSLERAVTQMGFHIPAGRLQRPWAMLAHLQGETTDYFKLASNLQ